MARRPVKAIVSFYCQDEERCHRRFWLQPFGLARVLAHGVVESPLLRMTKPRAFLLALSQNRDSASCVLLCYGLLESTQQVFYAVALFEQLLQRGLHARTAEIAHVDAFDDFD